jgi:hypothetical protein
MTVTPFGSGFLIRNAPVKDVLAPASEATNLADYGPLVTMCCHCRRVENKKSKLWQWVPQLIEQMPAETRNRLCPGCYAYHYSEAGESRETNSAA